MIVAPIPVNELQRLAAVQRYALLDTLPEAEYDRITCIASELCQTPVALISLIDEKRQWVKSHYGLAVSEVPRDISPCAHTINYDHPLIVEDTTKDERFWDNPAVINQPYIIFYAGIPLISSDGFAVGSICVIDHQPRQLAQDQQIAMKALAQQVVLLMELRKTNAELAEARRDAEELAQQKAYLLATLSHEIRTPLHALEGYTQALLDNTKETTQQKDLKRLQNVGRTLVRMVNNILDYSKLQANKVLLEEASFSLSELLQETANLQEWQARQKGLKLSVEVDKNIPTTLKGDSTRLLQVMTNLLSNALKFTREGEIELRARLLEASQTHATLIVEVNDTGIGIPQEAIKHLFNEYIQVSVSTTREYGGTGLGLAISRQLLELMGSRLEVRSVVGQGTTFWFQLTLAIEVAKTPQVMNEESWLEGTYMAVDDNPFNTKILTYFFKKYGVQVAVFNSPLEALESAKNTQYKGILLDLHMPYLDGYELAAALRPLQPDTPIIALSADESSEASDKVKEAGFAGFLPKPFQAQQLKDLLIRITQ
ncbi:GAF domain-containing hybrid sensor histidine kinase/response regulator [Tellurirhabdus bombi]|uniref:GAF domain-containing hybrid sensor histidine kinase/response regulator n=1 Tax=Tellurirhabdus bombi TaxID=2907205 RepID=UPI001F334406|nr:GAF domain-containing hybrid sensor histidine kinase/response regulator [Tellurirhabdus bombi]